jgi:hypothetical protein
LRHDGGRRWRLYGQELEPTVYSHDITALVEYNDDGAAHIIELSVRPSVFVKDPDGTLRSRTPEEERLAPITASTLARLKLSGVRREIARWWVKLPTRPGHALHDEATEHRYDAVIADPRAADWAKWASRILEEQLLPGRGYLRRLAIRDVGETGEPTLLQSTIEMWRKRGARLRRTGWLTNVPGEPGPLLEHFWRRNPEQRPNGQEEPDGTD